MRMVASWIRIHTSLAHWRNDSTMHGAQTPGEYHPSSPDWPWKLYYSRAAILSFVIFCDWSTVLSRKTFWKCTNLLFWCRPLPHTMWWYWWWHMGWQRGWDLKGIRATVRGAFGQWSVRLCLCSWVCLSREGRTVAT